MKQTDQYGLNQWDLSDRIRMEDFNADNFKIAAALAGLSGQMAGMASAADMDKLKTSLQNEDKRIWRSMPTQENPVFSGNRGFLPSADGSHYVLDLSKYTLYNYYFFVMTFSIPNYGSETYYLDSLLSKGSCIYDAGASKEGMAVLLPGGSYSLLFLPMKQSDAYMSTVFTGPTCGVGRSMVTYEQATGLRLRPASGVLRPTMQIYVHFTSIG